MFGISRGVLLALLLVAAGRTQNGESDPAIKDFNEHVKFEGAAPPIE